MGKALLQEEGGHTTEMINATHACPEELPTPLVGEAVDSCWDKSRNPRPYWAGHGVLKN